jgi:hypothetical protein
MSHVVQTDQSLASPHLDAAIPTLDDDRRRIAKRQDVVVTNPRSLNNHAGRKQRRLLILRGKLIGIQGTNRLKY